MKRKPARTEENKAMEAPENKAGVIRANKVSPQKKAKRGVGGYGRKG